MTIEEVTIANIIESGEFCIIFDTNIYLNLYEYSPDATEFFIKICNHVLENLVLPSTVKREFDRNHETSLNRQRNKFRNAISKLESPVNNFKDKLKIQFDILNSFKYPMIDELQQEVQTDITNLTEKLKKYTQEHKEFEEINSIFLDKDIIYELIKKIVSSNRLLEEFSIDDIYRLCADGKKRYDKRVPPGYKDAVNKSGVEAFGDFLIWKEALRYCQDRNKNLIFVTDDVKEDWYELEESSKRRIGFRKELVKEFERTSNMKVIGVTSNEFFTDLATIFNEEIPSTVEWIIGYNLENYIADLEKAMVSDDIENVILNTSVDYIDTSSLSGYDDGVLDYDKKSFEVEVVAGEFQGYRNGAAEYLLNVKICALAISNSYWDQDESTGTVSFAPRKFHKLEGDFDVQITRNIETYLDYWNSTNLYDELEITGGLFREVFAYTEDELCVECKDEIGSYLNYEDLPLCEECVHDTSTGTICTTCGRKYPYDSMYDGSTCYPCFRERQERY